MPLPPTFKWTRRPFLYFLFNWGTPVYVTEHPYGCLEYARRLVEKWPRPIPDGALQCVGYRPGGEPGIDLDSIDLTETLLKCLSND